jgi:ribosomal protein S18 acetylase RimI-like enzyme
MQFELTEALVKDLLFSMEDQVGEFYLDTGEGVIIGNEDEGFEEAREDRDRYICLPGWDSTDGFRLMEHFTAGLRNPALRNELSGALNRGKGVFRAFKNIISRYPETEKLWFNYKERGMRRKILNWYNGLREEWGLERVGGEPEDTGDLVLEDFRFRPSTENDRDLAAALHGACIEELRSYAAEHHLGMPYLPGAEGAGGWCFPGDPGLTAETVHGDFAGYIAAVRQGETLYIHALEVQAQYRGLGIGEELLTRFIGEVRRQGAGPEGTAPLRILVDLPSGSEGFSQVLSRDSFSPCMVRYSLEISDNDSGARPKTD